MKRREQAAATSFPAAPAKRARRRQEDRSREMRDRLLNATLHCLGEMGYAGLSIAQVAQAAQVSRGAVLHHYATKFDLAAAAMQHFFETRFDRLHRLLTEGAPSGLTVDQRLDAFRAEIGTLFPVNLEIINTLRTNPELRQAVLSPDSPRFAERLAGYKAMFPQIRSEAERETFISVLVAFLRGLCLESMMRTRAGRPDPADAMFEMFRRMVHLYFAAQPAAADDGAASAPTA